MSRFLLGDELGNIKVLRYTSEGSQQSKTDLKTIYRQEDPAGPTKSLQQLTTSSAHASNSCTTLAAAFSDGSCFLSTLKDDDSLLRLAEWQEPHAVANKFVGMALTERATFTCTSNGMLRRTYFTGETGETYAQTWQPGCTSLPSRLFDWRLSEYGDTFAYGGDEVDLSVWNTELAFQSQPGTNARSASKKRKRNDDLFSAETWRARNVPNDSLGLRQPNRISTVTYLESSSAGHHLMTGTQFGDLRRYDTRAARRPVSNWTGIGKVGGVKVIEKGSSQNELFMGDNGSNLYAIDLRNGRILYSYKGLSGAITSIAPSPTVLVSTALDRFARVHSTVAPPTTAGSHQERKGDVLEKSYLTSAPTVVVWDKCATTKSLKEDTDQDDGDDIWNNLENVS